ncbi:MAG: ABC transporter substrate-binding protein, partial [Mollicutes bacterium]|nr:ABC transporter substrate-binding protein [Mollicutes bacterium]
MKKVLLTILGIVLIAGLSSFFIFNKPKSDLKKVKVAEVTHSLFYTPQYVAHSLGYFKEEGLDVELILVPGADKVAAAVLSNDVDIGFSGTEATIYVYNQGEKDYLVVFSGLTKRDGTFLVSRKKYDNFKLEDLKGSYIIGGRKG